MWIYEKKLQFPVKITQPDGRMAKIILSQFGGPDGELAASIRYLSQKFTMVTPEAKATLNDIATEELAHLEMVGAMVHQLTQGLSKDDIIAFGDGPNDIDMIAYAGIGIAMGNAVEEVKQVADKVTAPVGEHGIAKALQELYAEHIL